MVGRLWAVMAELVQVPCPAALVRKASAAVFPGAQEWFFPGVMTPVLVLLQIGLAKKRLVTALEVANEGGNPGVVTPVCRQGTGPCEGLVATFITTDQRLFSGMSAQVQCDLHRV